MPPEQEEVSLLSETEDVWDVELLIEAFRARVQRRPKEPIPY